MVISVCRCIIESSLFVAWSISLASTSAAQAPCAGSWQPGEGLAGLDGTVLALAEWDPDGTGPLPTMVVAGGSFVVAGDQIANNVALYDPVLRRWASLAGGVDRVVHSVLVRGNGNLVVGTLGGVREWTGSTWQSLGGAISQNITSLSELSNGDLVVGGSFTAISGAPPINGIARWDGTQWQPFGNPTMPFQLGAVLSMGLLPNGDPRRRRVLRPDRRCRLQLRGALGWFELASVR